jgi:hypothetical protein
MTNNLKIALIVFGLLLILLIINNNKQNSFISQSNQIFEKNANDIQKILIQKNNEAIELIRIDTTWHISGNDSLMIKERSLESFFDRVLIVNRETLISGNPEKYDKFAISDSLGTHLALINSQNETIAYYVFGRSNTDYSRSYVRIGNDPNVYLTDQNVSYMLNTQETYWGEIPKENIEIPEPLDPVQK